MFTLQWHGRGASVTLYGALIVSLVVALIEIVAHPLRIAPQAAVHVECANLMLSGKSLYSDVLDIAPPMVEYISVLPVYFGHLLKMPICQAYSAFVWLLSMCSTLLLLAILAPRLRQPDGYLLAPFLISFALIYLFVGPESGTSQHLVNFANNALLNNTLAALERF